MEAIITQNAQLKRQIAELERIKRDNEATQELLNENQLLAQRLRELKAEVAPKKARKPYTRSKPYNVYSNPYLVFLKDTRAILKEEVLSDQPTLTGKELTCAVTRLAGQRWREMSKEDQELYRLEPTNLSQQFAELEEVVVDTNFVEMNLNGTTVWVDLDTNLYYKNQNSLVPIGHLKNGQAQAFNN